jgi:chromosome partitioning protein
LEKLRRDFDVVIVDSPPQVETDAKLAVRGADLVLVPVQPSPPDFWAAEATLKLTASEKRRARIVLNRAPAGGKLRAQVEQEILASGYSVFASVIGNRTGFAGAFAVGLGITEVAPKSVAARELFALLAEIEGILF